MGDLLDFLKFLKYRKRYWLWPLALLLIIFGTLLVAAQSSALAPFIYSLF
ncbi:DUF5989 family protein [Mucilaginibacter sp. PPCGB 2223]|nr:DUF5989 family protein [Mucilaginibacter sp. PPCGB 2223]